MNLRAHYQGFKMANLKIFRDVSFSLDIISGMPLEISTTILRMLDAKSIIAARRVCTSWYQIYKTDPLLQRTVRKEVQKQKRKYNKNRAQYRARGRIGLKLKMKKLQNRKTQVKVSPKKIKILRM